MSFSELTCAVAKATLESAAVIDQRGFHLCDPTADAHDLMLVLDCPFCGGTVLLSANGPDELPEAAECVRCDTVFDYRDDEVYATDLFAINRAESRPLARAA